MLSCYKVIQVPAAAANIVILCIVDPSMYFQSK